MKKIIGIVGLLALVLALFPCHKAEASNGITDKMIEQAIEKNYGFDNFVIAEKGGTKYLLVEFNSNKTYGGPYNAETYGVTNWYVTYDNVSGTYMERLVSPSYWHCGAYAYDTVNEKWSDSYSDRNYFFSLSEYTVIYSSKDVKYNQNEHWGELKGTVFFKGAPHLTKLAKIVEQSSRQQTPMYQVISLMPLAISLVVSFLSLRKFFKMLQTTLFGA